jgi:hypothetical protein
MLAAAILVGCSPDVGPTDPNSKVNVTKNKVDKVSDLWPLQSGNAWTYEARQTVRTTDGRSGGTTQTPTLKVVSKNGSTATIGFIRENKLVSKLTVLETPKGITQKSIQGSKGPEQTFDPPTPLFEWPMKVDEERKSEGVGFREGLGSRGKFKTTLVYKGEYEVDTPAGRMLAHRFDTLQTYSQGSKEYGSTSSVWLVPKIGVVRSIELLATPQGLRETEMKLTSYTVK